MLTDLVMDTNVFVHASNPSETYCNDAKLFITALKESSTSLCVDEGFDIDQSHNKSLIGLEYLENLHYGMLGFAELTWLAQANRLVFVSRDVHRSISRKINQMIRNKRDRTFLRVATNSEDHFFCSHDFRDMPPSKRVEIKRLLGIDVKASREALPHLK
jgi:hypothetical protein